MEYKHLKSNTNLCKFTCCVSQHAYLTQKKPSQIEIIASIILRDPGADKGGEGKSKWVEKYGTKKSKERREEPPGTKFQMVTAVLAADWCQKTFVFFMVLLL